MNGILAIYKEKGYTSRDVVNIISKVVGTKKVGHTGTLDPMASGSWFNGQTLSDITLKI